MESDWRMLIVSWSLTWQTKLSLFIKLCIMHCQCNPRFCHHFPVKSELLEHLMFWPQSCDGRPERGDWSSNHPCTGTHLPIGNTNFIFSCETFSSGGAQVSLAVSSSLIGCSASNQPIRGERRQSLDDFPQPGSLHNPVSLTACKTRSADSAAECCRTWCFCWRSLELCCGPR